MIETYSTDVTVSSGSLIPFNIVANDKGCSTRKLGASMISLNSPGYYRIDCSASVVGSSAGDIEVALTRNGSVLPQTVHTVTAADTTSVNNLSFSTVVPVSNKCCCAGDVVISVINSGIEATFNNIDLLVTKL